MPNTVHHGGLNSGASAFTSSGSSTNSFNNLNAGARKNFSLMKKSPSFEQTLDASGQNQPVAYSHNDNMGNFV
jgi:hypothetical protein